MKKRIVSYTERESEDLILLSFLDNIEKGFYIDVGANDPWQGSVTKCFYEIGWNGINIEPLPDMYDKLCEDRPNDINLNFGAGNKSEKLELRVAGELSTFNKKVHIGRENKNTIKVEVKTLNDIVSDNFDYLNNAIHFCKIDVEGFEKEVLEGIDFNIIRPWIFCIESTIPGTHINIHDKWENILIDNDYSFVLEYGVNRYYIDKNQQHLFSKVNSINNIHDKYEIFYMNHYDYHESYTWKIGNVITAPLRFLLQLIRYRKI